MTQTFNFSLKVSLKNKSHEMDSFSINSFMTEAPILQTPVSTDLQSKSIVWFLYNRNFRHERVDVSTHDNVSETVIDFFLQEECFSSSASACSQNCSFPLIFYFHIDTGRKLNIHKTLRRRPGRPLNVSCTLLSLRPVSMGLQNAQ